MATLSIVLSDNLAISSQNIAAKLGISRVQFIHQAIEHAVNNLNVSLNNRP